MNKDQRVVEVLRHQVFWFLFGFWTAGVVVSSFRDWILAHGYLLDAITTAYLLALVFFEWRARRAKSA